jgi:prepilin-type N-terminal cleavage/methylation domain-containing protein
MSAASVHPLVLQTGRLTRWRGARAGAGFTLVELLVSIAMISVLSVAMASAVLVASRAVGKGDTSVMRSAVTGDVVARIEAEIRLATGFAERSANAVTFQIPDRNGDGVEETIRYAWSGVSGAPLTRVYNGAAPEVVAEDVRDFDLNYLVQSIKPAGPNAVEGEEVLLISHEDAPGGNTRPYAVDWDHWCAQYFRPTLPANAVAWRVTRVQFMARQDRSPPDGTIALYVTSANEDEKPAYPVLEEVRISEAALATQTAWVEASLSSVKDVDPSQGLCVVIAYRSGTRAVAVVEYEERGNPMTPNTHWMTTGNRGYSFTEPNVTQDMVIRVYGTVTTPRSAP